MHFLNLKLKIRIECIILFYMYIKCIIHQVVYTSDEFGMFNGALKKTLNLQVLLMH